MGNSLYGSFMIYCANCGEPITYAPSQTKVDTTNSKIRIAIKAFPCETCIKNRTKAAQKLVEAIEELKQNKEEPLTNNA